MADPGIEALRRHVKSAEEMNMLPTASFFGEKIVCLPGAQDSDLYNLAQIYYKQRQYKRALQTVQKARCANADKRFRLLAGQCLAESKDYEQCLLVLGDEDSDDMLGTDFNSSGHQVGDGIDTTAGMWLVRASVYDHLQNRVKAAACYQHAVRRDVKCYQAFDKLVESHMLSGADEAALLSELHFTADLEWLKVMYHARCNRYDLSISSPLALPDQDAMHDGAGGASQGNAAHQRGTLVLANSVDAKTAVAEALYYHNDFMRCHAETEAILAADEFAHSCLPYHLSSLVELKMPRQLFIDAHRLVDSFPESAEAWYAVACYYYLTQKMEKARFNFLKATTLSPYFAPAWVGYGHTFAAQDESDQALAAYRTASRFFSGCHVPPLCIGMEYAKTGNLQVSDQFLAHTLTICAMDPLVYNEIGVLRYLQGNYEEAAQAFEKGMELSQAQRAEHHVWHSAEASVFNLGHCYRKMLRFHEAVEMYTRALRQAPNKASTYTALAFTHHLMGNFDNAINFYHKALGIFPDDTLTTEMLERALKDAAENSLASGLPM